MPRVKLPLHTTAYARLGLIIYLSLYCNLMRIFISYIFVLKLPDLCCMRVWICYVCMYEIVSCNYSKRELALQLHCFSLHCTAPSFFTSACKCSIEVLLPLNRLVYSYSWNITVMLLLLQPAIVNMQLGELVTMYYFYYSCVVSCTMTCIKIKIKHWILVILHKIDGKPFE